MPGAMQPNVLATVHSSCKQVLGAQPWVSLDAAAVAAYASQLDAVQAKAGAAAHSRTVFPIKFDSQEAEITFLALHRLLDFGCGFDALLRASSAQRGWRETMQYGCFGLALGAGRLNAAWMRAFSPYTLHTAFGFDSKVEQELQPGITISKPGPLAPLAAAIQQAIVEAGNALEAAGAKSLGALILEYVDGVMAAGKPATAAGLVEELADAIPGFQDSALFTAVSTPPAPAGEAPPAAAQPGAADGGGSSSGSFSVTFLRKAQALAGDLAARFGADDARFAWTDAASLAADSGAVLPAVLTHLGLLKVSGALAHALEQQPQQELPLGPEERALRAAAVAAADAVVAAVNGQGGTNPLSAHELGCYLLSLVDDSSEQLTFQGGAVLRPHRTLGTTAY